MGELSKSQVFNAWEEGACSDEWRDWSCRQERMCFFVIVWARREWLVCWGWLGRERMRFFVIVWAGRERLVCWGWLGRTSVGGHPRGGKKFAVG